MKTSTFSERLAEALEAKGMKPAQLCRVCKLSKSTVSQYLSGRYEAKYDRIVELAQALGCSAGWLAGHDSPAQVSSGDGVPVLRSVVCEEELFAERNILTWQEMPACYIDGGYFILPVEDVSMEPWLRVGDRLLCLRQDTVADGQLGVFVLDGRQTLVRIPRREGACLTLTGCNPYYPELALVGGQVDRVRAVARVILSIHDWS